MKHKDIIILNKILEYIRQVEEACTMFKNDYTQFINVSVFQNACCMCVLQIGELCKNISEELRAETAEVPWKAWCGIRDIFAHQYASLDCDSAWETLQNDLPQLKRSVQNILTADREKEH